MSDNLQTTNQCYPILPVTVPDRIFGEPSSKPVFINITGNGNRINIKNDSLFMSGLDDFRNHKHNEYSNEISKSDIKGLAIVWSIFMVLAGIYMYMFFKGLI
jgi:hypothetical protein